MISVTEKELKVEANNSELSDDEQFEHAINHAHMMWRLSYKQECERRDAKMRFNEALANEALEAQAEQNHLPQHQVKQANEAARQRRHENTMRFWHSIKSVVLVIILAAIAIRAFMYFVG